MGTYTELVLTTKLDHNRPAWVDKTLRYMKGDRSEFGNDWPGWVKADGTPEHPLFTTERWRWCLGGGAVYMARAFEIGDYDHLTIAASVKNYDDEYGKFLDWLLPHISGNWDRFLGYLRYEEPDDPTLIYRVDGAVRLVSPGFSIE